MPFPPEELLIIIMEYLSLADRRCVAFVYALEEHRRGHSLSRAMLVSVENIWILCHPPYGLDVMHSEILRRRASGKISGGDFKLAMCLKHALCGQVTRCRRILQKLYAVNPLGYNNRAPAFYRNLKRCAITLGAFAALSFASHHVGLHVGDFVAACFHPSPLPAQTIYRVMLSKFRRSLHHLRPTRLRVLNEFGSMLRAGLEQAARSGHLGTIRWLNRCGAKHYRAVIEIAAVAGHQHVVEWAFWQIPDANLVLLFTQRYGNGALTQWALAHGAISEN